jgi:hypothetical protein
VKGGGFRFSFALRIGAVVCVGTRAGTVMGGVEFEAVDFVGTLTLVFGALANGDAVVLLCPVFFAVAADDEAYRLLCASQLFP